MTQPPRKKLLRLLILATNDCSYSDVVNFKMTVETALGKIEVPRIVSSVTLGGRQSKVVVTDYAFGNSKALYSTAQILFGGRIGSRDVLFLYGDSLQEHEASIAFSGKPRVQTHSSAVSFTASTSSSNQTTISFLSGIEGLVTVYDSDEQLVLYSDKDTAATFWSPMIAPETSAFTDPDFPNFWQFGTNSSILVGGPYLVRNASISGNELALQGDLETGVRLIVIAPDNIKRITWNGDPVTADLTSDVIVEPSSYFAGQLFLKSSLVPIAVPSLTNWKFADSLPEISPDFSDASWTVANHTTTNIPYKPYYGDKVLYGCDYGL